MKINQEKTDALDYFDADEEAWLFLFFLAKSIIQRFKCSKCCYEGRRKKRKNWTKKRRRGERERWNGRPESRPPSARLKKGIGCQRIHESHWLVSGFGIGQPVQQEEEEEEAKMKIAARRWPFSSVPLSYRETNFPAGRRNFIFFFFFPIRPSSFFFLSRNGCNRVCVRIYNPCNKQSQTRHQTHQSQWLEAFVWPLSRLLLDRKKTSGGELDVSRSSRPNESPPPTDQTFAYYTLENGEERKKRSRPNAVDNKYDDDDDGRRAEKFGGSSPWSPRVHTTKEKHKNNNNNRTARKKSEEKILRPV